MTHKKRSKTQKPHPIDQQHSLKGVHANERPAALNKEVDHLAQPPAPHHINPHATFSPRTTLSKGRGK